MSDKKGGMNPSPEDTSTDPTTGAERDVVDEGVEAVLGLDNVFEALGHPRRRYLLYTLIENGEQETLTALAAKIAAWEADIPVNDVDAETREEVYLSLYHCHVPKLAASDILEYKEDEEIVVNARNTEQVQQVLDSAGASEDAAQESHAGEQ